MVWHLFLQRACVAEDVCEEVGTVVDDVVLELGYLNDRLQREKEKRKKLKQKLARVENYFK